MKRLIFTLCILCFASILSAQRTYYYECEKHVDKDGVISKFDCRTYFTFNNGDIAFESDANGNKKFSSIYHDAGYKQWTDHNFYYRGMSNGAYWFCSKSTMRQMSTDYDFYGFRNSRMVNVSTWDENYYILVSTDYSTINIIERSMRYGVKYENTYVFKRTNPTKPEDKIPELIR